jgi:iron complex outermembrane receptor protein
MRRFLATLSLLFVTSASSPGADPPPNDGGEEALFRDYQVVEAASLHAQTLLQAPAAVTIITADDIRIYGYRTLVEALSSVTGFYASDDKVYRYLGIRGFSLPGDYSTRFLLMLNGHYLTDNVYGSNGLLSQDFPLDMDLVERIEVIRGPSSALYGSNGVFATINVVTKSPVDVAGGRISTETASFGERKIHGASSIYLGDGANLLLSGSTFHRAGQDLEISGFGRARKVGRESGYHAFAQLTWKDWSFTALNGRRDVRVPTGFYGTIFDDVSNRAKDERGLVEALYSRKLRGGSEVRWRTYYDRYLYWGRYNYDLGEGEIEDNRDRVHGDWVGSRLSYGMPVANLGLLTVGAEVNADIRNRQLNDDVQPAPYSYLELRRPDLGFGLFAQQEWALSKRTSAYLGVRLDVSRLNRKFVSPRLALVHQLDRATTVKALYGRAFRNPSAYEQAYEVEGFNIANPLLGPEKVQTFEGVLERSIHRRVELVLSGYRYGLTDLIQGTPDGDGVIQFQNAAESRARGAEMEAVAHPGAGLRFSGSLAIQHVSGGDRLLAVVNSPRGVMQVKADAPLGRRAWRIAGIYRRIGARRTLSGGALGADSIVDVTLSSPRLGGGFEVTAGARNLLDRKVFDVVGPEQVADRLPGAGRSAFVKLIWTTRD